MMTSILVVDDDRSWRATTASLLNGPGRMVMAADRAELALGVISHVPVDLAILDLVMPGDLDGLELAWRLEAIRPGIRIAIVSAYHADELAQVAEDRGYGYSAKEDGLERLLALVEPGKDGPHLTGATPGDHTSPIRRPPPLRDERELQRLITRFAQRDPRTGLPTMLPFAMHVDALLDGLDPGREVVVISLDLDLLGQMRGQVRHGTVDRCVRAVSQALRQRFGWDEPAIARCDVGDVAVAVVRAADRAPDVVTLMISVVTETVNRTLGLAAPVHPLAGMAIAGPDTRAGELIERSRQALAAARSHRGGWLEVWTPSLQLAANREITLLGALADDQLELWYQPVVDLRSFAALGAEGLLRWRHPEQGVITPDQFLDGAERAGLMVEINDHVLTRACRSASTWPEPLWVGVNVSGSQLVSGELEDQVRGALRRSGLSPSRLRLELTETTLLDVTEEANQQLHRLRDLGVRVGLDDFGTGYSSLAHLQQFPLDFLKVDRTFMGLDPRTGELGPIASSIVHLAERLGLDVVAEGVESDEQRRALLRAGCVVGQGFLVSPALPEPDLGAAIDHGGPLAPGTEPTAPRVEP
jgi:EAL domain-containing protein (putative c-di-GMP-specific phosphodiesterase class I)/CheY-like chemotaxis protein